MRVLLCAAAAFLAAPASAQLMGATELEVAVPVKGAASAKPIADVYYVVGEAGAHETYTLTGKGPASITLFGPDGSEILTSSGNGTVKLEAVLPFTDVFTIAIARTTTAAPYSLSRRATVPTLAEALMAGAVGYEARNARRSQCWIIPGIKVRVNFSAGREEYTLAADRNTMTFVSIGPNGTTAGDMSYSHDGAMLHRTARLSDGRTKEASFNPPFSYDPQEDGRFTGYLCKQ